MKQQRIFKIIAVISYLLIILMGDMIGLPVFLWLLFTLFDFGNTDQLFAFLAVMGVAIIFIKLSSAQTIRTVLLDVLCFILMASPVVRRLMEVPIEKFMYLAFIIPAIIFVLLYFISICLSIRHYQKLQSTR
jgi:hypothetical protein